MVKRFIPWLALPAMLLSAWAEADQQPLWEVGAGVAAIDFPVYRGSNERKTYILPAPYLSYHGEYLQVSRERARALFFKRDRVELDVSVNGSVPARSALARAGMPDLDATLELGPSLNFHLYYDEGKRTNVDLRLPVRMAIATNFVHAYDIGWLFQPQLNLDLHDVWQDKWNMGFVMGPVYADRRYNQYFYSVAPQYATPTRPAYTAGGGYSGYQFIWALSKRFPGFWTGGFMKWDDLRGAVFIDSPLVKSQHYFTVGWAITWILDKSGTTVEVPDD